MEEKADVNNFEDILKDYIGGFSRFQLCFGLMIVLGTVSACGNLSFMAFGGADVSEPLPTENCTEEFTQRMSSGNITFQADFYSVVAEWGLVCENAYKNELATSIGLAGKLLAAILTGHIADAFGRHRTLYWAFLLMEITGFASIFAPSWGWFCILRFVNNVALSIWDGVVIVSLVEYVDEQHRVFCVIFTMWHVGYSSFAAFAYATKYWKTLLLMVNAVPLPLVVLFWFVPESARWLIQKNKLDEANKVLKRVARWNKRDPSRIDQLNLDSLRQDSSRSGQKFSFWHLFATRKRALYSITLTLSRSVVTLTNCVFIFSVGRLAGNAYINLVIYVALWCWAPFVPPLLERRFALCGRRSQFLVLSALLCISFMVIILIKALSPNDSNWQFSVTVLFIVGTVFMTMLHVVGRAYNAELFPTEMRCLALSLTGLGGGFSAVLAPQLLYLARFWDLWPPVVVATLGAICFLLGFFVLPETSGKPMVESQNEKLVQQSKAKVPLIKEQTDEIQLKEQKDFLCSGEQN